MIKVQRQIGIHRDAVIPWLAPCARVIALCAVRLLPQRYVGSIYSHLILMVLE